MVKAGIIDPLKVIRTALVDAARYISTLMFHSQLKLGKIFWSQNSIESQVPIIEK